MKHLSLWICSFLAVSLACQLAASRVLAVEQGSGDETLSCTTPVVPVGLDAYRMWDRWPYQRIGVRAYMRSTYDRAGGNETADASHFLYQTREDFNVALDVEGPGVLYFVRTNHWHGSPWHYEVDGADHIVQETTTADPTRKLDHSVFIPENLFPNPLTWTYSITKGADLMWVPIPFERRFRLAYSRTFYGTGYYIYHLVDPSANLSRPIESWDGKTPPDQDVLDLLNSAGSDIAPQPDSLEGRRLGVRQRSGVLSLPAGQTVEAVALSDGPTMIRALQLSVPREQAVAFGRSRLRVTWDGRGHASIDAPIDLLFGTGTFHNRQNEPFLVKGLPMVVRFTDRRLHLACYFPMPFFRSAKFELIGPDQASIPDVRWTVRTQPYDEPANHVGYFHATYRDHADPEPGQDNVFLDTRQVEGGGNWCGNFVGTSFIFSDRAVLTTLEGDPRFFFDDSQTPQAYGTGTEEWGGGGDYWGGRNMTLPLAGHPVGVRRTEDANRPEELIQSAYRFLLADLMPFGNRAVIRLEHGGTNESVEHYQSVTYWYGLPAATLVPTDALDVGDPESEKAHGYVSPDASEPYQLTSRYEWGIDHLPAPSESRETPVQGQPKDYADFQFVADAGKTYTIWVRGKTAGHIRTDATWLQFDERIGTNTLGDSYDSDKGFGNWRDRHGANQWAWSSSLPQSPPQTVTFDRGGKHRLRVQYRHGPHRLDQIWLSATQKTRPDFSHAVDKPTNTASHDQIVLDATDAVAVHGGFAVIEDEGASTGKALYVASEAGEPVTGRELYPAHTETGRSTTTSSEFTLNLRKDNLGVLLRRTLDYKFPNQRANVYVKAADGPSNEWRKAGVWYLAGSNTCYHSFPREAGELGKSQPVVQTSNRRFRDDEFLIPRQLTEGRDSIRVRVEFTPVEIPLLPGLPVGQLAWSEIRYRAYCYVMPEFTP
jgi:hypothetical protein